MNKLNVSSDDVIVLVEHALLREEKFGGLILIRKKVDMLIVNKVGYALLDCCRLPCKVDAIVGRLQARFAADKTAIANDAIAFMNGALNSRLIRIQENANAER